MKWSKNLLLMLHFGLLLLGSAQGIKCYECKSPYCKEPYVTQEKECNSSFPLQHDRCITITTLEGVHYRGCRSKKAEDEAHDSHFECDQFSQQNGQRWCFCYTDLCNGSGHLATIPSKEIFTFPSTRNRAEILGYSQCQMFLVTVASAVISSASWISNPLL
ncbi:unnamed protein product [Orchesella dallaii]|uniref:Protein quiver n=1 Tax=Orchesella dallaii TaxID=48710 RepID=A0ABP1S0T2_9HEXA